MHICESGGRRTNVFGGHRGPNSVSCVKSGQRGDVYICESRGRRTNFFGGHRGPNSGGEYS